MGIVIASLLMAAIALTGFLLISQGVMNAVDLTTVSGKETHKVIMERASTSIDVATATYIAGNAWSELMVLNDGKISISDFNKWDLFMQYQDTATSNYMHYQWISYSSTYPPGNDQWAKQGIYLDQAATIAEQYEPGILNPGEYLKLAAKLQAAIKSNSWVYIKANTSQGISDNIQYKR